MKLGKTTKLKTYSNFNINYGTVDFINLKSIYLKLNCWVELKENINNNFSQKNKKLIKYFLNNNLNDLFKNHFIIDIDISDNNLKLNKKSFLKIDITLYNKNIKNYKDKELKEYINLISKNIIDEIINYNKNYIFFNKKN